MQDETRRESRLSRQSPTLEYEDIRNAIAGLLRGKGRKGAKGAMLGYIRTQPILLRLRVVRANVTGDAPDDTRALERSFQNVFQPICEALEPAKYAAAALALFGFEPLHRDESMTRRRQFAGTTMGYNGNGAWDAFRKRYEPIIVTMVADELHRLELDAPLFEAPVPPAVRALAGPTPRLAIEGRESEDEGAGRAKEILYRGYAWIGDELTYQVSREDFRHHIYTAIREIEVVRPDPQPFRDRYQWSGHGHEGAPRVLSQGHRLLGEPFELSNYRVYYIHFDTGLQVGQRTRIHVEQEFEDTDLEFHPFLGAPAHQGQEWLILRVILPVRLTPSTISLNVYASRSPDAKLLHSDPGRFDVGEDSQFGTIEWNVNNLIKDGYYAIEWGYDWGYEGRGEFYPPEF